MVLANLWQVLLPKITNQGSAKNITENSVELDNGESVAYDYLVVATGSKNSAGTFAEPEGTTLARRMVELKVMNDITCTENNKSIESPPHSSGFLPVDYNYCGFRVSS